MKMFVWNNVLDGLVLNFSAMAGIEFLCIDKSTTIRDFKNELRWNGASYFLRGNV
jgi:L-arabinose isomerase